MTKKAVFIIDKQGSISSSLFKDIIPCAKFAKANNTSAFDIFYDLRLDDLYFLKDLIKRFELDKDYKLLAAYLYSLDMLRNNRIDETFFLRVVRPMYAYLHTSEIFPDNKELLSRFDPQSQVIFEHYCFAINDFVASVIDSHFDADIKLFKKWCHSLSDFIYKKRLGDALLTKPEIEVVYAIVGDAGISFLKNNSFAVSVKNGRWRLYLKIRKRLVNAYFFRDFEELQTFAIGKSSLIGVNPAVNNSEQAELLNSVSPKFSIKPIPSFEALPRNTKSFWFLQHSYISHNDRKKVRGRAMSEDMAKYKKINIINRRKRGEWAGSMKDLLPIKIVDELRKENKDTRPNRSISFS